MNVAAIIQARLGSTRFPQKVLADLGGQTVLHRVEAAARKIEGVTHVLTAWPDEYGRREEDVLGRYADAANRLHADVIVRLTSDCPLFDPQVGTLVLTSFMVSSIAWTYASNVYPKRTWPDGMDVEVFSRSLLDHADRTATDPYDREHVTPWMQRHATDLISVKLPVDWSSVRLTVDSPEDLEWLRIAINSPRSGSPAPAASPPAAPKP